MGVVESAQQTVCTVPEHKPANATIASSKLTDSVLVRKVNTSIKIIIVQISVPTTNNGSMVCANVLLGILVMYQACAIHHVGYSRRE